MIEKIRSASQTWYFKTFLGILALCFVLLWGVGDMLFMGQGGRSQNVATVGSVSISPQEFVEQLRREAAQIQATLGQKLSPAQLQQLGVIQGSLRRLVQGALIDQEAERLGLVVSDADVRQKTLTNPSFLNKQGKFERGLFEAFLYNANLTEKAYVKVMRQDVRRSQLMGALGGQMTASSVPAALAEPLFYWQNEKREILYTHFLAKDETQVDAPTEQNLIAFHQDNAVFFTIPETRDVTYLVLSQHAQSEDATNEGGEDLYALSTKIEDSLAEGLTLEEVAAEYGLKIHTVKSLTPTGENADIPEDHKAGLAEFISTAFETEEGELSPMVPSADGTLYFSVRVDFATPTHLQPLEEAKDQVIKLWKEKRQMELAKEYAQEAANAMNQGKYAFPKMAIIKRYTFARSGPENEELRKAIDPRLTTAVFNLQMGQAIAGPLVDQEAPGYAVLQLEKVVQTEANRWTGEEKEGFEKRLGEMLSNDILSTFMMGLEKKFPVSINEAALKAILSTPDLLGRF
ncbi:MAG: hypothetical protein GY915_09170 [bacterium]|nr:hypothetical protein [bacterium]